SVIQNDLFDLGADLSRPNMAGDSEAGYEVLRIVQPQIDRLEREIDEMNGALSPLRSFILPGGTALSAHLHLARTIARRAERRATDLASGGDVNALAVKYLNRVSDWLFVAARLANLDHGGDILWVPGASRES
ncbi:MAG: cob(I)yrinic acid a,c-diamide adenosyltransferase, partial [Paracoccus sp. (in: a-proteobacteria)]|nr:cob(I)yrinic acid a,c-diamide adenosyltransferase [Paracoccus sp. (in: a-proteobacteria)]